MKKILCLILCLTMLLGCTSALADEAAAAAAAEAAATMTVDELVAAAQGEGQLFSVGMPDEWANWKSLWAYITDTYGINHSDTDMSSAEELARFALDGKADADIGDIGISMTGVAMEQDLLLPYKPTTWDSIPDYAKEENGKWIMAYTCTTAFMTDLDNVEKAPTTWAELLEGDYKVWIGDIEKAAQAYVWKTWKRAKSASPWSGTSTRWAMPKRSMNPRARTTAALPSPFRRTARLRPAMPTSSTSTPTIPTPRCLPVKSCCPTWARSSWRWAMPSRSVRT